MFSSTLEKLEHPKQKLEPALDRKCCDDIFERCGRRIQKILKKKLFSEFLLTLKFTQVLIHCNKYE